MTLNRYTVGALAGSAVLLVGGGAALASSGDQAGTRCEQRVAKIAEEHGITVEQLEANLKARVLARIDAAEKAGRISSERAAGLRERVENASLCAATRRAPLRVAVHGLVKAAADFLGLDRDELRAQLPGNSLAGLAKKQGKSVSDLEAAMVAPAKDRLAKAVADGKLTQARADLASERLDTLAARLATKVFPKK